MHSSGLPASHGIGSEVGVFPQSSDFHSSSFEVDLGASPAHPSFYLIPPFRQFLQCGRNPPSAVTNGALPRSAEGRLSKPSLGFSVTSTKI